MVYVALGRHKQGQRTELTLRYTDVWVPARRPVAMRVNPEHEGEPAVVRRVGPGRRETTMSRHIATVSWERSGAAFIDNRYSREHSWSFDGGIEVRASASPHVVPLPLSVSEAVDPEEAFVAALASCHMLWLLFFAAKQGFVVDSYRDEGDRADSPER